MHILNSNISEATMFRRELQKGSAELLVLSLLAAEPRHGYDLAKLIAARSQGALRLNAASLYPLLYRLERRGWIEGRWVERAGQRRRRYYRLTATGRRTLEARRQTWAEFVRAVNLVVGLDHA